METILIIAGVVLLIINITMVVKFFQIARNIERLADLYVDGVKSIVDENLAGDSLAKRFYKLPLLEITKEEADSDYNKFVEMTSRKRVDETEKMLQEDIE